MKNDKLPFGIDFVVEQDLVPLGFKKLSTTEGYKINCPFCERNGLKPDRNYKFGINLAKDVGRCVRCNTTYKSIQMHQALSLNKISFGEAREDLIKRWNGLDSNVKIQMSENLIEHKLKKEKELYPCPIEIRNEVYRNFLNQLELSDQHRKDLLKRGLTDEEIEEGMYKTVPNSNLSEMAYKSLSYEVCKALKNHYKWGIPGFYDIRTAYPKVVHLESGFFCPIKTRDGLISGLQIRYDTPKNNISDEQKGHFSKYKWFVSNYKNLKDGCGASGIEDIHYAGNWNKIPKVVYLTEGELKADIASNLAKKLFKSGADTQFMAVIGVNNIKNLAFELRSLKEYGLEQVNICLDMDYKEKEQVKKALMKIKNIVSFDDSNNGDQNEQTIGVGLKVKVMDWPDYKGIDDYFLSLYKKKEI